MKAAAELEIIIGNIVSNYQDKIMAQPEIFMPLAKAMAQDAHDLPQKVTDQEAQIEQVSRELTTVMRRSLYVLDLFNEAVQSGNYQGMAEHELLERVEKQQFSGETTNDIQAILRQMALDSLASGDSIEQFYFENYFTEYCANLLEIHIIGQLVNKTDLLSRIKTEMAEEANPRLIYNLFAKETGKFKEELPIDNYNYQQLVK